MIAVLEDRLLAERLPEDLDEQLELAEFAGERDASRPDPHSDETS